MSLSKTCLICASLFLWGNAALAQEKVSENMVDILGLRLGDNVAKVHQVLQSHSFDPSSINDNSGQLTYGQYTSNQLMFGTEAMLQSNPSSQSAESGDDVRVTYDMRPGNGMIYFYRQSSYNTAVSPITSQEFVSALTAKYGKPDSTYTDQVGNITLVWAWDTSVTPDASNTPETRSAQCMQFLHDYSWRAGGTFINGNYSNAPDPQSNGCGTWLMFFLQPDTQNTKLISQVLTYFGDFKAINASFNYITDAMQKGDTAAQAAIQQKSAQSKPSL